MDPRDWGPCAWKFLFDAATARDAQSGDAYRRLIELLPDVLPCASCRAHAATYIRDNPVDVERLPAWLQSFRDAIRRRNVADARQRRGPSCRVHPPRAGVWLAIVAGVLAFLLVVALRLARATT